MKFLRLILFVFLVGPLFTRAAEVCCAADKDHTGKIQTCTESKVHLEAAESKCCESSRCTECSICNVMTSLPIPQQTAHNDFVTPRLTHLHNTVFAEIVAVVLTPPPTL